ncbi:MAG: hypothetical protein L3J49_10295 [Desulfobulbaceae bacterium]|nr:hypothetical protein [Desulfobulbaceae bacterium]
MYPPSTCTRTPPHLFHRPAGTELMAAWGLIAGIVIPVLLAFLLYFPQRRFVFSPRYYHNRAFFKEHEDLYRLHRLKVAPGVEIEGITYEPDHPAVTILYFGGKEQDTVALVQKWSLEYPEVRWIGFNYRGYGKSDGRATEKSVLHDSLVAYDWAGARYEAVAPVGFSLGSSIAAYVASRRNPKWTVLVAPFDSVRSLIQGKAPFVPRLFIRYKFETASFLRETTSPVYIYNSIDDEIVPPRHVENLRTQVRCLAGTEKFTGYSHDQLLFSTTLKDELKKIFHGASSLKVRAER